MAEDQSNAMRIESWELRIEREENFESCTCDESKVKNNELRDESVLVLNYVVGY